MTAPLHLRSALREGVVAALVAAGTAAAARVHDSPADMRTSFPALVVEDAGETQAVLAGVGAGATVQRTLVLDIAAEVQQVNAYARQRDDLLAQVEIVMSALSLPGLQRVRPAGYAPDRVLAAERPIAAGRQRFELTYVTRQGIPGAPV